MTEKNNYRLFFHILGNTLLASVANNFLWFALVFWAYIETRSVLVTSLIGGLYLWAVLLSWIFFWAIVDHHKKKYTMLGSTTLSFVLYIVTALLFFSHPIEVFTKASNPILWVLIITIMLAVVVWNIRNIAMSTMMTLLFDDEHRDKANGTLGISNGIAFWVVSIFSWLTVWQLGMWWAIIFTLIASLISIIHLLTITFPKEHLDYHHEEHKKIDLMGTIKIIGSIGWLFALIFFSMFNNFLGWVFMSLMDPYGLSLVSVEVWWFIWWFLSLGFIVWWMLITKWGLGKNPIKTLLLVNAFMWFVCIFFTSITSIILTTAWLFIFTALHPYIEAAEQTILQKVVPFERQGRVFGFSQSVEQIASPLTAFFIGPIAEFVVIPFMTNGKWVQLLWSWFWTGQDRAIALIFSIAGIIWLTVTLWAFLTKSYKKLCDSYAKNLWVIDTKQEQVLN